MGSRVTFVVGCSFVEERDLQDSNTGFPSITSRKYLINLSIVYPEHVPRVSEDNEEEEGTDFTFGFSSGRNSLLIVSFCSVSCILIASERILFFLSRSLLSASVCASLVLTIKISCFRKVISVSLTVLVFSDKLFLLELVLLRDVLWFCKDEVSVLSCDDVLGVTKLGDDMVDTAEDCPMTEAVEAGDIVRIVDVD